MRLPSFALIALLALAACDSGLEKTDDVASPIVGGHASDATDDEVVLILTHIPSKDTSQGQYYENCTGTLLSPSIVLTARHCVSATTEGTFTCKEDGTLVSGPGGTVGADYIPSNEHVFVGPTLPDTIDPTMFPGVAASYVHTADTITCNADVALIVLQTPIPNAKIAPIRLDGDVTEGEGIVTIGWGATATDFIPPGRQRRDGVSVVDVGPSPTVRIGGELAQNEFLASESVCTGDSGGPAFDATTDAVVGVVSRGQNGGVTQNGSGCVGTQHTFEKTSGFKDLVMSAFAMTGETPWIEGQPEPVAGAGGAGGQGGAGGGSGKAPTPKNKSETTTGCATSVRDVNGSQPILGFGFLVLLGASVKRRRNRL